MNILKKIKEILNDSKLDSSDKLIEINSIIPKEKVTETVELFGNTCEVKREGNTIIYDGSYGVEYTDTPRLENQDDIYYTGCGCTWDTDLDGKRYYKRYCYAYIRESAREDYKHLEHNDIIDNDARLEYQVIKILKKYQLL